MSDYERNPTSEMMKSFGRIRDNYTFFSTIDVFRCEAESQRIRLDSQLAVPESDVTREGMQYFLYLEKVKIEHSSKQRDMWDRYDKWRETR